MALLCLDGAGNVAVYGTEYGEPDLEIELDQGAGHDPAGGHQRVGEPGLPAAER